MRGIQTNGMRKTVVIRRQCCHGFVRRTDGRPGCSALKMENLLETMKSLERTKFVQWIESAGLADQLKTGNYTGFTPSNEAIIDFEDDSEDVTRSLLKALEDDDRQDLLELLELSEMVSQLEDAQNVTFFAPSKDAIKSLSNETREQMLSDPQFLKKVLQHHLIPSHTPSISFMDNKKLATLNGHNVHIKLHETFPGLITAATVQCAYIVNHDNQACGAIIHKINKVIMPPKGSIVDALKDMDDHEIVLKLLQNTDLETKLAEDGPFTFLAPTDEAFERMRDITVEDLQQNNTLAEKVLKLHILPEVLCCNGVSHSSPFHRQYVRTLDGSVVPTYRGLSERVRFGRAKVTRCDVPATNGLVHSINRVILPERPRSPTLFGMDLWPFF
ncbi:transforming growth factor-beta-induced protein ig-h3 [Nephila pilipes]|uniref:Transforming growth factor-beta-induced protein ig-h3 n=1 Tax=Nephila pilipes TaxID=299642 RepID=A0A8X6PHM5_NEPPI|nr:transforming growth factor-beta-induced protein ig-h3 [Nephila pilipes]